jgi:putative ABC transport system substrate-binding protein
MMNRRAFLRAMSLSLLAAPLVAEAQPAAKVARIGHLSLQREAGDKSWVAAFRQGLQELGYVEGRDIAIEQRHAAGRSERLPELASELVSRKVDVLVVYGLWALIEAGWKAPGALPIVFTIDPDPVGRGLVASLGRPGGNITGLSDTHADLVAKRLELLREAAPSAVRVGVLFNPASPLGPPQLKTAQAAAPALGMTVFPLPLGGQGRDDIDRAFEKIRKERFTGILVIGDPTVGIHRNRIAELALKSQLPAISTLRESVQAGLLMSYGTDFHRLWRRAATYVDKILKGTKPSDLPVEQPTEFELLINLKTAKALGITIPRSLLMRAHQIIE